MRILFDELMEGVTAMKAQREGKLTLRTYTKTPKPLPKVDSRLIIDTRERLQRSRTVFARKLRINASPDTSCTHRVRARWSRPQCKSFPGRINEGKSLCR
jgi:hypothetical protein